MPQTRLNILLITVDDMDAVTPGAFGGPTGLTPHIDALAAEGMVFRRGHVAAAVCQPSRSAIMSGQWPHRNGAEGFEPVHQSTRLLTDLLRPMGYVCGILGKVQHLQPVEKFGWDVARDMRDLGMGRSPARYGEETARFVAAASEAGRPWFLMANAHDPHRPFHGSVAEREKWTDEERASYPAPSGVVDVATIPSPGFLPDLPQVRTEYHEYLASSRRADDVVGAVLAAVHSAGAAESTLVFFLSDNGMAFPFAKANCYLRSSLTPFVVRWPGVVTPGAQESTAFVSMLDIFPTVCKALGEGPGDVDGTSLLSLLIGAADPTARDHVFTVFHETSGKARLEMRCVQDARWGYVWNAWADGTTEYRAENMEGLTWAAMVEAADPQIAQRVNFYLHRRREELYDLDSDPDCQDDLAGHPDHTAALSRVRALMAAHLTAVGDPLAARYRADVGAATAADDVPSRRAERG
jgi:N-sulfoglucosamine sulfohydrolase